MREKERKRELDYFKKLSHMAMGLASLNSVRNGWPAGDSDNELQVLSLKI